jgi:hypothetical protein
MPATQVRIDQSLAAGGRGFSANGHSPTNPANATIATAALSFLHQQLHNQYSLLAGSFIAIYQPSKKAVAE